MGENAVATQAEDYARKTSDTMFDIKELMQKVVDRMGLQIEVLKDNGKLG